uniref:Endonuclease/exonuclease/phosphatase domain-containing protein n=1 Tax=Arcella intermedia TaxID=1963864 RepID=A0A6B2LH17_9EUKA
MLQYNILFKKNDSQERMKHFGVLIEELNPDCICLQEVTTRLISALLEQPWARGYHVSDPHLSLFKHHGVVVLSKFEIEEAWMVDFPTTMDRKLLGAKLKVFGKSLLVGTFHLASGRNSTQQRKQQIEVINKAFQGYTDVVLMGDTNISASNENNFFDKKLKDMWLFLYCDQPGYTYADRARLDRIYLTLNNLEPLEMRVVGKGTCISDHNGLFSTIKINSS